MNTAELNEYSRLIAEANRPGETTRKAKEEFVRSHSWEEWAAVFAEFPDKSFWAPVNREYAPRSLAPFAFCPVPESDSAPLDLVLPDGSGYVRMTATEIVALKKKLDTQINTGWWHLSTSSSAAIQQQLQSQVQQFMQMQAAPSYSLRSSIPQPPPQRTAWQKIWDLFK